MGCCDKHDGTSLLRGLWKRDFKLGLVSLGNGDRNARLPIYFEVRRSIFPGSLRFNVSDLNIGNDLNINSEEGNITITEQKQKTTKNIENSLIQIETGAKAGNAYADVYYIAKSVNQARKNQEKALKKLFKYGIMVNEFDSWMWL